MAGLGTLTLLMLATCVLGEDSTPLLELGKSSVLFTRDIYQIVSKTPGNILISPSSLQTILALIQTASYGQTLDEMSRTLSLNKNKTILENTFKELLPLLRNLKSATLNSANKVYIQNGFDISPNFSKVAIDSFNAEIANTDFTETEKTSNDINQWVESKTNNKIKNLIAPSDIDPSNTRMVLVNALYFNGEWENPFDKNATMKRRFYTNSTQEMFVNMMVTESTFAINEDNVLDAKFLNLPYAGNEFIMTVVLPNKRDGLPDLESKIDQVLKTEIVDYQDVIVSIPKFTLGQDVKFTEILKKLGMIQAFSDTADLSGLSISKRELKISQVLQKTFIDVNEKGTEAAAASAGFVVDRIFGGSSFHANHPFLFVLRQKSTGIVEFIGRYSGP